MTTIPMYTPKRDYFAHKSAYDEAINEVLESGFFINGPQIKELEATLASFVGAKHCVAVSSGTDALLVALMALGVKPGDEVITCAHTWISSSEVISLIGGVPVFIDIDRETFVMDLDKIEAAITDKTVGIMPINIYGQMVDIDKIKQIAKKHNLWIIEDGAQSFGSTLNGIKSCNWSDIGCTSFFPSKPLGCYGDAGACFTNDDDLATKIKAIKNHGGLVRFQHDYIGINGRMDTLQAAVLNVKMRHFQEVLESRRRIANYYTTELSNISGLNIPKRIKGLDSAWAQYTLVVDDGIDRDAVVQELKNKGIGISIFYPKGLHEQPCFRYLGEFNLPETDYVCQHIINIPLFAELTDDELNYIVKSIKEVFGTLQ